MEIMRLGVLILPVRFLCFTFCFRELINHFLKTVEPAAVAQRKKSIQATLLLPQALTMHGARTNTISGDDLVFGFMPVWTRS